MIVSERVSTILKLALPASVGIFSTMVMEFIDLLMVGKLGTRSLAAIGIAGLSHVFVLSFVVNISPIIQGVVASQLGEGRRGALGAVLNGGLVVGLLIASPLVVICYWISPWYLALVSSDSFVAQEATPYFRVVILASLAVGMNCCFEGFWRANGNTRVYMLVVIFANLLNIFLNYIFIFGNFGFPEFGVLGAGFGTFISLNAALLCWVVLALRTKFASGFLFAKPSVVMLKKLMTRTLTLSIGDAFFFLGMLVFFSIVAQIGSAELAVVTVLARINLLLLVVPEAIGLASATFVANALGEGLSAQASQWGWDAGKIAFLAVSLLGLPLLLFPSSVLSVFFTDPKTINMAITPLQLTAIFSSLISLIYVFGYILFSLGDGGRIMAISFVLQWLIFLPVAWFLGPQLNYGFLVVWSAYLIYGVVTAFCIVMVWVRGEWKKLEV